jgi:hypothetical protein
MATTTAPRTVNALSDEELQKLVALIKDVDSVELKLTVPDVQHRSTAEALGLDPLKGQIRQVVFFDTPKLALEKKGVVVRARRIQGKGDDSVVKLRPVVPHELPEELRTSPDFRVEVDALPGGFVCSGTLKRALPGDAVTRTLTGKRPVRKLFSKEQRAFFAEHAPEGADLDDLAVLGPIFLLKGRITPKELGRRIVAEIWFYPDGSRVLELSTRCATDEAFQVAAEARAFLAANGVDLSGEQQTKTRKALGYFARNLPDAEG